MSGLFSTRKIQIFFSRMSVSLKHWRIFGRKCWNVLHEFGTNCVVLTYTAKGVYFTVFTLKKKWKYMILKVSPLLLWKKNLCILSKISFKMFIDIFSSNYWRGEKNHYFSNKFIYAHYWNGIISYKSSILVNFRIHYFLWAKDFDKMLIIPFQLIQWL